MCGICGTYNLSKNHKIDASLLKRMILIMRHRGPDEFGIYKDERIGLGHARLSIIDLSGGRQPIHNEDESLWVVFNGEIFNYIELREELIKKGHNFYTKTDTEVLVHLYEEKGEELFGKLNGQFAMAIWDKKNQRLMLARDRIGIRPLFYTVAEGSLLFGSEVKAVFVDSRVKRELDLCGLDQLFTFWATLPPRTIFKGISELAPAHYLIAANGKIRIKKYWDLDFSRADENNQSEETYAEQLLELIKDAIRLRLRADVPVAAYLSGGLDSSFITALVRKYFDNHLKTFSVSFSDKDYDESLFQKQMADFLGTEHRQIVCGYADVGRIMPEVIWHTEKPLIRTAPAPLYLLAKLVRDNHIKVVLTGEGADEILAGYDLFREMKIRRFWAKYPDSNLRPRLFGRLYQYLPNWPRKASLFLEFFYRQNLLETNKAYYSHIPKWNTTCQVKTFFSRAVKEELSEYNNITDFWGNIPDAFSRWDYLSQAQYIEILTLLSGNLLSSQGDRMMMAHSVEGRFPFLDYRVMELCAGIPAKMRLNVLKEKYILKKIAGPFLPVEINQRVKQGYRAPDSASFFPQQKADSRGLEYVEELLNKKNVAESGYFDPDTVDSLVKKCKNTDTNLLSAKHNMAVVGIVTTLLLDKLFIRGNSPTADHLRGGLNEAG